GGGGQPGAGSGGGGGSPDAGTGGGGGEPDAGSIGGGGQPDAGTGGGTGGGQPDAGNGGVAADECDGLGPDPVGAPNGSAQIPVSQFAEDGIVGAMSDGSGVVALIERSGKSIPTLISLSLYDQSGTQLGSYDGANTRVTEQLIGFMVSDVSWDLDGRGDVAAVDEHGNVTATTGLVHQIFGIAPYSLGGVIALGFD